MSSDSDFYYDSDEYRESKHKRRGRPLKRRKGSQGTSLHSSEIPLSIPFSLMEEVKSYSSEENLSFDQIIDNVLPEFLQARASLLAKESDVDIKGDRIRPLTRLEASSIIDELSPRENEPYSSRAMMLRKLKVDRERRRAKLPVRHIQSMSVPVTPLPPALKNPPPNPEVIDALLEIKTTPFENSFLSRLHGSRQSVIPGLISVDWETITPWMDLMNDIRDHYTFSNPHREQPAEGSAPIVYTSLQPHHLPQVHDLLERIFWNGVDISDSLDYSPEKCTVIATYKKLVVGLAILSSPQETYITYLAVKAGWDKSQIARTMLYHLIMLNPGKDITLHVSVNNSAMLLYNQFGFKAEEFIAGFYENYLDPLSRASKNAFRLRLRQQ